MNKKFGGKQPTGTPSLAWSCAVVIVSLLAGASVVHNFFKPDLFVEVVTLIFKPDLTLPPVDSVDGVKQEQLKKE